jgi:gamma-glutamyltranspeptidase/glutathione hydrolase
MTRSPLLFVLLFCLGLAGPVHSRAPEQAAIATAHPLATQAAQEVLAAGGNAFDAAIAVTAMLAVVEPYGSGLGGGGFYLLRQAGSPPTYRFLDARERAPLKTRPELFQREGKVQPELSLDGPLAAAIPGIPAALADLARQHARLSLARNLAPAIRVAREGFAVDRIYRERASYRIEALRADPESARLFLLNGEIPAEGHLLRQPELAESLEILAEEGHSGFYSGALATRLVEGINRAGGIWSMEDLASYHLLERPPLRVALADGRELISAPPPSAGGVILGQSLLMLEQLPWQDAEPVQRAHLTVEVLRRAYRDRGELGDPDFVDNPTAQLLEPGYLATQATSINLQQATASASLGGAGNWKEGNDTTHFSVLDREGNAVAATLSINLPFGAAFVVPGTGILLNNEMDDFAVAQTGSNAYRLAGSAANRLEPGKRPLSSMSPSFIESNSEFTSFGTPGGSRIPSMTLLAIMQYLDDRPMLDWVGAPRFHHQFQPDLISHEADAFDAAQQQALRARGHQLQVVARRFGNQQVLYWNKASGKVAAASDPRGIGTALPAPLIRPPLRAAGSAVPHPAHSDHPGAATTDCHKRPVAAHCAGSD